MRSNSHHTGHDIFDVARSIPAHEVAQGEGIMLQQKGTRWWALCPFHGEKTPSLCFFSDGGWTCFGCSASGADGTSFLAALRGITQLEAAQLLAGQATGPVRREAPLRALARDLEAWRATELKRLHVLSNHFHEAALRAMEGMGRDDPFPEAFVTAVRRETDVAALIAAIESASLVDLYKMKTGGDVG